MEPGWTGIHPAARAGKYRIKRTRHGHDQLRCTESWQWGRKSWGENAAWFGRRRSGFCILWNSKYILWQRYYQTGMCAGCSEYSDCVLCIRWHLQSDGNGINRSLFQRNVKKSLLHTGTLWRRPALILPRMRLWILQAMAMISTGQQIVPWQCTMILERSSREKKEL